MPRRRSHTRSFCVRSPQDARRVSCVRLADFEHHEGHLYLPLRARKPDTPQRDTKYKIPATVSFCETQFHSRTNCDPLPSSVHSACQNPPSPETTALAGHLKLIQYKRALYPATRNSFLANPNLGAAAVCKRTAKRLGADPDVLCFEALVKIERGRSALAYVLGSGFFRA